MASVGNDFTPRRHCAAHCTVGRITSPRREVKLYFMFTRRASGFYHQKEYDFIFFGVLGLGVRSLRRIQRETLKLQSPGHPKQTFKNCDRPLAMSQRQFTLKGHVSQHTEERNLNPLKHLGAARILNMLAASPKSVDQGPGRSSRPQFETHVPNWDAANEHFAGAGLLST